MTVFKEDEIVQVKRRWKAGRFLLQLTCALMHEPLGCLGFCLLLVRSAFQADAEDQVYSSQPGWRLLLEEVGGSREGRSSEVSAQHHGQVKHRKLLPQAGAALGWALKPQLQRSCTAPLWHRAVTAPTAGRGGKSCPALLKIFFTGEWRGENYSFNPRQFPPICQHMVEVIIIWLKYKASLRLFFCFNSLTILLWNLGEILWILLSFSIVPW